MPPLFEHQLIHILFPLVPSILLQILVFFSLSLPEGILEDRWKIGPVFFTTTSKEWVYGGLTPMVGLSSECKKRDHLCKVEAIHKVERVVVRVFICLPINIFVSFPVIFLIYFFQHFKFIQLNSKMDFIQDKSEMSAFLLNKSEDGKINKKKKKMQNKTLNPNDKYIIAQSLRKNYIENFIHQSGKKNIIDHHQSLFNIENMKEYEFSETSNADSKPSGQSLKSQQMIDHMMMELYNEIIQKRKDIVKNRFVVMFGICFVYYAVFILFYIATDTFPVFGHSKKDKQELFCEISDYLLLIIVILQMITTFYGIFLLQNQQEQSFTTFYRLSIVFILIELTNYLSDQLYQKINNITHSIKFSQLFQLLMLTLPFISLILYMLVYERFYYQKANQTKNNNDFERIRNEIVKYTQEQMEDVDNETIKSYELSFVEN